MKITISTQDFERTGAIVAFVGDRLRSSLARLDEHVRDAQVFLRDVNGPKGGRDKQALVRIRLRAGGEIVVERTRGNLYAAVSAAARRARRGVQKTVRRQQRVEKRTLRQLRHSLEV